jgi:hypothetical protein
MAAGYQDLFLEQGTTFNTSLTLTDAYGYAYNLMHFSVASQARRSYYSANATITFNTTITDAPNGVVNLYLDANTTANITPGTLLYDVIIKDPNNLISRVLEGRIFMDPSVTSTTIF